MSDPAERQWILAYPRGYDSTGAEDAAGRLLIGATRAVMDEAAPFLPPGTAIRLEARTGGRSWQPYPPDGRPWSSDEGAVVTVLLALVGWALGTVRERLPLGTEIRLLAGPLPEAQAERVEG
jgi:hypothetical protein